jgi:hypothetical protein
MSETDGVWRLVAEMQRWEIVAAACRRAIIQTDAGISGRLVSWDPGSGRGRARIEFRPGSARTFRCHEIIWLWVEHSSGNISDNP